MVFIRSNRFRDDQPQYAKSVVMQLPYPTNSTIELAHFANQALDRIINFFPEEAKQQLLLDVSLNLRAIISQRLIPSIHQGLVPAVEILINTPHIASLIEKGQIEDIKDHMEKSREQGMQTFDGALFDLYKTGKISQDNAIAFADSKNNLSLRIRLSEEGHSEGDSVLSIDKRQ